MSYKKLVRDNIPDIITNNGGTPRVRVMEDKEYMAELVKKLGEEYKEFIEAMDFDELADVLEVVYAIADAASSREILERARKQKLKERGGFSRRLFLEGVDD